MLYLRLLVAALFASVRARGDLVLENLALRHQLTVYTRGRRRPRLRRHDRRFWSLLARGWSGWRGTFVMVEPDTVVRWHRSAWRAYWRWKSRRGPGRPHIPAEWQRLILRIATEHPRWGAVRIVGELRALGCDVSARTVSRYRQQALRRPPSQSWPSRRMTRKGRRRPSSAATPSYRHTTAPERRPRSKTRTASPNRVRAVPSVTATTTEETRTGSFPSSRRGESPSGPVARPLRWPFTALCGCLATFAGASDRSVSESVDNTIKPSPADDDAGHHRPTGRPVLVGNPPGSTTVAKTSG